MFGSIEAGGTKFVCAIGDKEARIIKKTSIPTTTPEETMTSVFNFFDEYKTELRGIGIGSFGPIDVNVDSSTYGYITNTPKENWSNFNFLGAIKDYVDVPLTWTTDVNSSAFGEAKIGAGKGLSSVVYYTIGTGFGGGAIQEGEFVQGYSHPEMGHVYIRRHSNDNFEGVCPYHRDCMEGMASGPAIQKRMGMLANDVHEDDPFWEIEANYIAQAVYNATLYFSPDIVVLGGGVMKKEGLIDKIRVAFEKLMNNYLDLPNLSEYIVTPELGDDSATKGNLLMAIEAVEKNVV